MNAPALIDHPCAGRAGRSLMAAEARHIIEVTEIETTPLRSLYRAECSCGWICADDYSTELEAQREGDRHAKGEPTEDEDEAAIRRGFESAFEADEGGAA